MTRDLPVQEREAEPLGRYGRLLRRVVLALVVVAGLGVLTMMVVTCAEVICRLSRSSLTGAYDIVKLVAGITMAAALPYTTAVRGHVAIEYFFHKLGRRGRRVVDAIAQVMGMALFGFLTWECVEYGLDLRRTGVVTPTLQIPVFWVPHVIGVCCAVVVLVILYNLLQPGKELIKP